jgi:hypothetical protein
MLGERYGVSVFHALSWNRPNLFNEIDVSLAGGCCFRWLSHGGAPFDQAASGCILMLALAWRP